MTQTNSNRWKLLSTILVALTISGCQPEDSGGQEESDRYLALTGLNVIDGLGNPPMSGSTVLIRGDIVEAVGPGIEVPPDVEVMNLDGMTVLPGLIDMHGHLYANVGGRIESQFAVYPKLYLAGGVTTIFSPGEFDPEGATALRRAIRNGEVIGPDVMTAGPYFDDAPSSLSWIEGVSSGDAAVQRLAEWTDRIDAVKVNTRITEAQLSALVRAAEDAGLFVTGHLESVSASRAAELGIHGLEHGIFSFSEFWTEGATTWNQICDLASFDPANDRAVALMDQLVEGSVYVDPTTIAWHAVLPDFKPVVENWERYLTPEAATAFGRFWSNVVPDPRYVTCMERALENQYEFIRAFHDRGGTVVVGTDPVAPLLVPGYGVHREMSNFVDAGLTPLEAVRAATFDAAAALGREAEIGSVAAGKKADLIVVDGDPAIDIEAVGRTVMVFKNGKRYDPAELRNSVLGMIGSAN